MIDLNVIFIVIGVIIDLELDLMIILIDECMLEIVKELV